MKRILPLLVFVLLVPAVVAPGKDQTPANDSRTLDAPSSAGPKDSGVVQHGAQPNDREVRPGTANGDFPSASAGETARQVQTRHVLGLPVTAVLVIGAALIAVVLIAGVAIPTARRRAQARGNGTFGSDR